MKKAYILEIFRSHYCKLVFLISLIVVYFFTPKKIFYGPYYTLLGILFMIMTSSTLTCFVRNIKDRVFSAKASGVSFLGILSMVFGFSALQVCTIGAPVCGATIGGGMVALIFPGFAFNLIEEYSVWIILISIFIQFIAIYYMNCFKSVDKKIKKQK